MQKVQEFILRHRSKFSQLILLNDSAKIEASCDSIFNTKDTLKTSVTSLFPFLESIFQSLWTNISEDSNITFTKIQTSNPQLPGIYDFTFSKINIEEKSLILWSIYDYTDLYTDFQQFQQRKNELEIHRETLERRHKALKNIEDIKIQQNIIIESLDHIQLTYFNKIKSALLSPVNALDGLTFLMTEALKKKDRKYTEQLRISLKKISLIIDELDTHSNNKDSDFTKERFELSKLCDGIKQAVQNEHRFPNLKFTIDEHVPSSLKGNALYLQQILIGLLGNAATYHLNSSFEVYISEKHQIESKVIIEFKIVEFLNSEMVLLNDDAYADMMYRLSITKQLLDLQKGNIYVDKNPKDLSISITFDLEYLV